jgi:hypothetical protein
MNETQNQIDTQSDDNLPDVGQNDLKCYK